MFDKAQYDEFSPKNPAGIFHLPLASNPDRWESVINNATPSQIDRYPLMFLLSVLSIPKKVHIVA